MLTVDVAGEPLILLPGKAAFAPRHDTLLVADVHVGKATAFRRFGVPVPRGTTEETLASLSGVLDATGARRLVILGDLLHSSHARQADATVGAVSRWRAHRAGLRITLLRGNHDHHAGDPPTDWGIDVRDEPLQLGALRLRHDPVCSVDDGCYTLAGHLHPCVSLHGRAHDRIRVPCFHFGERLGVLPAFGAFTGMHRVELAGSDRCYAVVDGRVVPWLAADGFSRASGASADERCPG